MTLEKLWTMQLFLVLLCGGKPALAQQSADVQQETIRKLQARIDQIETQLAELQSEMETLHGVKAPKTGAIESAPPTSPPIPQVSPEHQLQAAGNATEEHHTFDEDEEDAPRLNNAPLEPNYPGFFYLPGTHTMVSIDGFVRADFIGDPTVSGLSDAFMPSAIPISASGPGQFAASIRGSRISADLRTPAGDLGSARAFIQVDFLGPNGTTAVRLRHFYGQLDNFLIGQTFTNFMDPDALGDTLNPPEASAAISTRVPQARYSFGLGKGWTDSISVEQPLTDVSFRIGGTPVEPLTRAPDISIRVRKEWEAGHFQVASIFRDLALRLPNGGPQHSLFGWGVNAAGGAQVFGRDNLVLGFAYGEGISRYVGTLGGLALDAALKTETDLSLRALPLFATYVSYQHYWSPTLRSNGMFGFVQVANTTLQPNNTYHKSTSSSVNLIWNPVGSLDVGAELSYGWLQNNNGATANAPRIQFTGTYRFVKHQPE